MDKDTPLTILVTSSISDGFERHEDKAHQNSRGFQLSRRKLVFGESATPDLSTGAPCNRVWIRVPADGNNSVCEKQDPVI